MIVTGHPAISIWMRTLQCIPEVQNVHQGAKGGTEKKRKGERQRTAILEESLHLAEHAGIDAVTFASVGELAGLTKSGIFAYFKSRDNLVISTLELFQKRFAQEIYLPSIQHPRGLPRLRSLFLLWIEGLQKVPPRGSILIRASTNRQNQSEGITAKLRELVFSWQAALHYAIEQSVAEKHLQEDTDADQLVHELYGLALALYHDSRFLRLHACKDRAMLGFERLISEV